MVDEPITRCVDLGQSTRVLSVGSFPEIVESSEPWSGPRLICLELIHLPSLHQSSPARVFIASAAQGSRNIDDRQILDKWCIQSSEIQPVFPRRQMLTALAWHGISQL